MGKVGEDMDVVREELSRIRGKLFNIMTKMVFSLSRSITDRHSCPSRLPKYVQDSGIVLAPNTLRPMPLLAPLVGTDRDRACGISALDPALDPAHSAPGYTRVCSLQPQEILHRFKYPPPPPLLPSSPPSPPSPPSQPLLHRLKPPIDPQNAASSPPRILPLSISPLSCA